MSLLCKCLVYGVLLIVQLTRSIKHNIASQTVNVNVTVLKHSACTSATCSDAVHITVKILLIGLSSAVHIVVVQHILLVHLNECALTCGIGVCTVAVLTAVVPFIANLAACEFNANQ